MKALGFVALALAACQTPAPVPVVTPKPTRTLRDVCPADVARRIETVDLGKGDDAPIFSWIESHSDRPCAVAAVGAIADRLDAKSAGPFIDDFCGSTATYAKWLGPEVVARVEAAYRRFPYLDWLAFSYFMGLRYNHIDFRVYLAGKVPESWAFTSPRQGAPSATWDYSMYLASVGERGALDKLAAKIAATTNGNDATNFLASLADLDAPGVDEVLDRYAHDTRHADGSRGPGLTIAENVVFLRQSRAARKR